MQDRTRVALLSVCLSALATIVVSAPAAAWDYPGHRIVGAIADLILQRHYPATQKRVSDLLDVQVPGGTWQKRSLREVAVFPDCAKRNSEPYCGRPSSEEEKAYVERNPHHDSYHYTDVPLQRPTYVPKTAGTGDTDVVQMISFAVTQLRARTQLSKKDVKLTDTEAVWLLAHLVGDIHQPPARRGEILQGRLRDERRPKRSRHATKIRDRRDHCTNRGRQPDLPRRAGTGGPAGG
jgi:hypothetical protein